VDCGALCSSPASDGALCRVMERGDVGESRLVTWYSGLSSLSEKMEDDDVSVILLWRSSDSNVVTLEDATDAAKS
jgi:hypothetical protein